MARTPLITLRRFSFGLFNSICLCVILLILLLLVQEETKVTQVVAEYRSLCKEKNTLLSMLSLSDEEKQLEKKGRNKILSVLKNISAEIHDFKYRKFSESENHDKYSDWIPHPKQVLAPLSNNPYVIKNSDICRGADTLDYIVLIPSGAGNYERRQGIRSTWGNVTRLQRQYKMKVVFLLGLAQNNDQQLKINKENDKNHDIVQGNFVDTYHNLTHKSVLGLRWASEFCSKARRVLKVDDDVFIDTVKLFHESDNLFKNEADSVYCFRHEANTIPVLRSGKWKVDEIEFQGYVSYPLPYCAGFFSIMPTKMTKELYNAAYKVPFFWIEDFYIYGMLTDKAGLDSKLHDVSNLLSLSTYDSLDCFGVRGKRCNLLVGNAPSPQFMQMMWEKMLIQNQDTFHLVFKE